MTSTARSPRVSTAIGVAIVDSDGGELRVEIVDLSASGFKLRGDGSLAVGETVTVRVPRYGDYPAQIRWVRGFEAGGRFLEPVALN